MSDISSESDCGDDITLEQICEENAGEKEFNSASNVDQNVRWITFEMAKSNRTKCQECKKEIIKGNARINAIACIFLFGKFKGCRMKRFHPHCFSF
jgi:hypothetical protein